MNEFQYFAPQDLEGVLSVLDKGHDNTYFIAGGTDLIIQMEKKMVEPKVIINLNRVSELNYIKEDQELIRIGATTTFTQLERSLLVNKYGKILADAAKDVGSPQIRNLGTVGGNIANSSAAADSVTALMALDACVVLKSSTAQRTMKLEDFYLGNGKTKLLPNEVLAEVFFEKREHSSFRKLGRRKALAIVVLSVGVVLNKSPKENKFADVKIALGAVSRHPMRALEAEKMLEGKEISLENIEKCIGAISLIAEQSILNSPFKDLAPFKKESIKGVARQVIMESYKELLIGEEG